MTEMSRITGIGRAIDLRYPSNRFAAGATLLTGAGGAIAGLVDGQGATALWWGVLAGAAVFLAWALGRELDPDDPWSAGAAAIVALPSLAVGEPALAATALVMLVVRILVRTTGVAPYPGDAVVVGGLAVYVATTETGFPVAVVAGLALLGDRWLPGHSRSILTGTGLFTMTGSVVAAAAAGHIGADPAEPTAAGWALLALGVAAITTAAARVSSPRSTGDADDTPLSAQRLRWGRLTVLVMGGATAAWWGGTGIAALGPVWAASIGVAVALAARRGGGAYSRPNRRS